MAVSKIEYFGETLIDLTNDTVSADTILAGYTAHGKDGEPITGTLEVKEEQEKTITPSATIQEVVPDDGKTLSKVTVNGDSDLVAENIKKNVEIFGVTGTYEGSGGSSDDLKVLIQRSATTFTVPDGITEIGAGVFAYWTTVNTITLPSGVTSINQSAFYSCSNLISVSLPDGLTSIGNSAFAQCRNLEITSLPDSITDIGKTAFQYCTKLALTTFPENVTIIPGNGFSNSGLQNITFPEGITTINGAAFYNCQGLTSITFKGTPTTIANNAFNSCANLKTINVPWASGAVANAPWGATNATINYNYKG